MGLNETETRFAVNMVLAHPRQLSLFESQRLSFRDAINLSLASLNLYGERYEDWAVGYSGGKDSSATLSFILWAIETGQVKPPKSLTALYSDTRQELPPLQQIAHRTINRVNEMGWTGKILYPAMDHRFYVYILGRGIVPPSNKFRWCTQKLKIDPMEAAMSEISQQTGKKYLMMTGVRQGESAARDQRIALACSKDSGECGTGFLQTTPITGVVDKLAPIVHWRVCWVWDWLFFAGDNDYMRNVLKIQQPGHKFGDFSDIAIVYGAEDVRSGCVGCKLVAHDRATENLVNLHVGKSQPFAHLKPLLQIEVILTAMRSPKFRLRKAEPEENKDGSYRKKGQRMGPLTIAARQMFYEKIIAIQNETGVDLINADEQARIKELWQQEAYPELWSGDDIAANQPIPRITSLGKTLAVQPLLFAD